jgi:hypothetical protein
MGLQNVGPDPHRLIGACIIFSITRFSIVIVIIVVIIILNIVISVTITIIIQPIFITCELPQTEPRYFLTCRRFDSNNPGSYFFRSQVRSRFSIFTSV